MPSIARVPYALVAALMLVGFADEWFTFFPAGALEPLRADLGLTYAQAGFLLTALAGGGLVGFLFEVAADYVSRRVLASLGALAYGAAMIAFGLGDSFWMLAAAAFVWGAASDAFIHGCEVALVDLAGEDLPRVLARVNAWSAIGDLLAPLTLALAIASGAGWRSVFLGGGALMLAYGLWLSTLRLPAPQPPERFASPLAGVLAVLADGRVWVLALIAGLFDLLDEPLLGFTIAFLERGRGFAPAMATGLALGAVGGAVAGYLIAERALHARSPGRVLAAAAAGLCLTLPAMVFAPHPALVVAAGLAFGIAGALFYTALQSLILTLRPGQAGSTGAVVSTIGLAGVAFPVLAGWVADRAGLAAGLALYVAVPAAILALVILARAWLKR
ncbi:MAG: MFS transporter [Phenylobacterium sp.]|uniref:MFS transporter n=1 Tax=Phenylobacterium sp. TaxID=1871053 RepID=UPI00391DE913